MAKQYLQMLVVFPWRNARALFGDTSVLTVRGGWLFLAVFI
jgi:hypothetical protein